MSDYTLSWLYKVYAKFTDLKFYTAMRQNDSLREALKEQTEEALRWKKLAFEADNVIYDLWLKEKENEQMKKTLQVFADISNWYGDDYRGWSWGLLSCDLGRCEYPWMFAADAISEQEDDE